MKVAKFVKKIQAYNLVIFRFVDPSKYKILPPLAFSALDYSCHQIVNSPNCAPAKNIKILCQLVRTSESRL